MLIDKALRAQLTPYCERRMLWNGIYYTKVSVSDLCLSTWSVFVHNSLEISFYLCFVAPSRLNNQKRRAETAQSCNATSFSCIIRDNSLCSLLQRGSRIAEAAGKKRREYLPRGNRKVKYFSFNSNALLLPTCNGPI